MAINIPIVTDFNSKGLQDASNAFTNFRTKVSEADGAMGKLKAGFGAAGDFIKANAAQFTAVAGTAIAAFAVKAISDFQDLALAVDKFRDSTGVTLDEASRWTEVSGDLGLSAGVIETAINKMNKQASDGSKLFDELGVELKKHKDGTYDPHATFLDVIDALKNVKDPADKARIASGLLGKGWQEMANLIEEGSDTLRQKMKEVSDQKLINEDEVKKAEAFRDTMDSLNDTFQDVVLKLAEDFIPLLTTVVEKLLPIIGAAGDVANALAGPDSLSQAVLDMGGNIDDVVEKLGFEQVMKDMKLSADELAQLIRKDLVPDTYSMAEAWKEGYASMYEARKEMENTAGAIDDVETQYKELIGVLDDREAWYNLVEDVKNAEETAVKAFAEKIPNAMGESIKSLDEARRSLAEYIIKTNEIPESRKTQYIAALDTASWEQVRAMLDALAVARAVPYQPVNAPGFGGGPVEMGPGGRPIGTPPINFNPKLRSVDLMPTGTSGNVIVNVGGSVTTENDLVEAVRKGLVNAQRNGSGLVYSNF